MIVPRIVTNVPFLSPVFGSPGLSSVVVVVVEVALGSTVVVVVVEVVLGSTVVVVGSSVVVVVEVVLGSSVVVV